MLQRIQSLYLGLAVIALTLLFFFPIASFLSETLYFDFSIIGLQSHVPGVNPDFPNWFTWPLAALNLAIILLLGYTIYRYGKRPQQIMLTNIGVLLNVILVAAMLFLYTHLIEKKTGITPNYISHIGVYLPLVSLVFIMLANRAIKRDEKLVKSADRLR